jgi:hypothetical protein
MKPYVFIGPTMSPEDAREVIDAFYLPPAAQGDVYGAARTKPPAIGIVDGFFENVPAVWHKEILWALAEGVDVFGSSSMGALRAAELEEFGMQGVGRIFEWYRDGVIEDDDEVALLHAPAEMGFAPLSVPMVNVRATLGDAEARGIVSPATAATVAGAAKELHYSERTYEAVLARALDRGASAGDLADLEQWLPVGAVDQKRLDAVELLASIRGRLQASPGPKQVAFSFERTVFWERLERSVGVGEVGDDAVAHVPLVALVDELRLDPLSYARGRDAALLRELALAEAEREGFAVDEDQTAEALAALREEHQLTDDRDLNRWLEENFLSRAELELLVSEEATLRLARRRLLVRALRRLPNELRMRGKLATLAARASRKRSVLAEGAEGRELEAENVLRSYFEDIRPPSAHESLPEYVAALRDVCGDLPALIRAARSELRYREATDGGSDQ